MRSSTYESKSIFCRSIPGVLFDKFSRIERQSRPKYKSAVPNLFKRRTDQCDICSEYLSYPVFFLQKGKLVLRSLLLEGRYFRGDRYFRRVVTFGTVYGKNRK